MSLPRKWRGVLNKEPSSLPKLQHSVQTPQVYMYSCKTAQDVAARDGSATQYQGLPGGPYPA